MEAAIISLLMTFSYEPSPKLSNTIEYMMQTNAPVARQYKAICDINNAYLQHEALEGEVALVKYIERNIKTVRLCEYYNSSSPTD